MSQAGVAGSGGGGGGSNIQTITGNSGGAVPPTANNENLLGLYTTTVVGNPGSSTLTITPTAGGYPITPYVVGPVGIAGYQTIQSAATAAGLAGGGTVYIQGQSSPYTENITIPANVSFMGADEGVAIIGTHTPPASSTEALTFDNLVLITATDVLFSVAAGSTVINFNNCFFLVTNGYVMNLVNWTGELLMDNCGEASTNDGVINNTGGSTIKLINVEVGAGTLHTMNITSNNFLRIDTCNINCPVSMLGNGSVIVQNGVKFANNLSIGGNLSGFITQTDFSTGANQALTINTTGNISLRDGVINTSNVQAIGGVGLGTLTLSGVSFVQSAVIAGTFVVTGGTGFYPSIGTNGQVFLAATGQPGKFATLTSSGGTIAFTLGANALNLEVANSGLTWTDVTGATQTLAIENGYITNRGGGVTYTLPATATEGNVMRVAGKLGAWSIAQNANQQITLGSSSSTVGVAGSISSSNVGDCVELLCTTSGTSTIWRVISSMGNITVA